MVVPQRTGVRIKGDNLYRVLNTMPGNTFSLFLSNCPGGPQGCGVSLSESHTSDLLTPW